MRPPLPAPTTTTTPDTTTPDRGERSLKVKPISRSTSGFVWVRDRSFITGGWAGVFGGRVMEKYDSICVCVWGGGGHPISNTCRWGVMEKRTHHSRICFLKVDFLLWKFLLTPLALAYKETSQKFFSHPYAQNITTMLMMLAPSDRCPPFQ